MQLSANQHQQDFSAQTLKALNTIEGMATRKNMVLPKANPASIRAFSNLPVNRQMRFLSSLQKYESVFDRLLTLSDEFLDVSAADDCGCLEIARKECGISFSDDLYNTIEDGDIIEIYDTEAIQIYRNLNFFKSTNYNLLDIISNPWMYLWDRSSVIQGLLESFAAKAMSSSGDAVIQVGVPPHIIKERAFGMTQALITRPKWVGKVTDTETGRPFGLIFTVSVTAIAEGPEAEKIGFV